MHSVSRKMLVVIGAIGIGLVVGAVWMLDPLAAQTAFSAEGVVESTSGGFMFPDGSVQTSAAVGGLAPVEDTGQILCYDSAGTGRDCAGTGEDGETQAGVAWPTPRFTDNGNGTVTDNLTGLIWLQDANCRDDEIGDAIAWQGALDWVDDFNTMSIACDNYTAMTFEDWRLPNIKELHSLSDLSQGSPALPSGHPFLNVPFGMAPDFTSPNFWSSNSPTFFATSAYVLTLDFAGIGTVAKSEEHFVWPVRGGQ